MKAEIRLVPAGADPEMYEIFVTVFDEDVAPLVDYTIFQGTENKARAEAQKMAAGLKNKSAQLEPVPEPIEYTLDL